MFLNIKPQGFLYFLYILCLQEAHFTGEIETLVGTHWVYKCVIKSSTSNSKGVAIFLTSLN